MVQVRQQPVVTDGQIDIEVWLDQLFSDGRINKEDRQALLQTCEWVQQVVSGHQEKIHTQKIDAQKAGIKPFEKSWGASDAFQAGLEMVQILADLHLDMDTLQAAVLYRVVREDKLSLAEVEKNVGKKIANMIDGVLRMAAIGGLRNVTEQEVMGQSSAEQVSNLRKMLLALIDDVRVALIKITERTCAIRAVKNAPLEKRRRLAKEVRDIYAPLAHRLGIGHIRWELEDLAFRYLETESYQQIARLLDEKRLQRQQALDEVITQLKLELNKSHIQAEMKGRVKHIYSIWRKMREKHIGFDQVYDVRAVRLLVNTVHECYMALGTVHSLWRAIPNEFDDYIANPKENGYRSLHTAVIGSDGKVLEVQIRTYWMNEEAEFGVCAHWQYKDKEQKSLSDQGTDYEQKVEWLRQVLEWHEEHGGDSHLIDELRSDVIHEKIYVFTPEGDVVELEQGATALDFAYHVHTGLGHRCRGARVNGTVMPLYRSLNSSDQVEIIAGKHEVPNREWLSEALGYVQTARARAKIQLWFRQQDREQHIQGGSILLDREFKRLALSDLDRSRLAEELKFTDTEALYAAIGSGECDMNKVLQAAQILDGAQLPAVSQQLSFMPFSALSSITEKLSTASTSMPLMIVGVGNMQVELAACCKPDQRYAISGEIVARQRVRIHRQDCEHLLQALDEKPKTIIRVTWGEEKPYALEADLEIKGYERTGLLRDITECFDCMEANVLHLNTVTDKSSNTVSMQVLLEIANLQKLSAVLSRLNQIANIISVRRL